MKATIAIANTERKFKVLGFNDDQCSCDVCGKQELKGTYALEDYSTGEIIRAGSTCGAVMAGWTTKEFVTKYKAREKEKLETAKNELRGSVEYIAYEQALNFLNNEDDKISSIIHNEPSQQKRTQIDKSRRTFESRLEYLQPLSIALKNKREQINIKHSLKQTTYLS